MGFLLQNVSQIMLPWISLRQSYSYPLPHKYFLCCFICFWHEIFSTTFLCLFLAISEMFNYFHIYNIFSYNHDLVSTYFFFFLEAFLCFPLIVFHSFFQIYVCSLSKISSLAWEAVVRVHSLFSC